MQSVVKEMTPKIENNLSTEGAEMRRSSGSHRWLVDMILDYEDLLRSAADWLWETDADLLLTHVSEPLAEDAEVPPGMILGRDLRSLRDLEESGEGATGLAEALEAGLSFRDVRLNVPHLGETAREQLRHTLIHGCEGFMVASDSWLRVIHGCE